MTNAGTIGQPVIEQKRQEQELKALYLKAGQHAAKFAMLYAAKLFRFKGGLRYRIFDASTVHRPQSLWDQLLEVAR